MLNDKEQYLHIPSYILNDSRLDPTKKILLSYIISLSKTEKGCYVSNKGLANYLILILMAHQNRLACLKD